MSYPEGDDDKPGPNSIVQSRDKALASSLAVLQEDVVGKMLRLSDQDPERFECIGGYRDEELLWIYTDGTFQGIEEVNTGLTHSFIGGEEHYRKVGVHTPNRVSLGLHTDMETWEAIRQHDAYGWEERFGFTLDEVKERISDMFAEEEVERMTYPSAASDRYGTYYFADRAGNSAKVVSLPRWIAEGRVDLQIEGHPLGGIMTVQVPMFARDFVLMKAALETINRVVDKELQSN